MRFFKRVINVLEQYNPGFSNLVEDWVLLSPSDFQNTFGVYDGNHEHIQMSPNQLFEERPFPGYNSYGSLIDNLYLCGAGTHPGSTVTGACGYNWAQGIINKFSKQNW